MQLTRLEITSGATRPLFVRAMGLKNSKMPPPPEPPLLSPAATVLASFAAVVFILALTAKSPEPGAFSARRVYSLSIALLAASSLTLSTLEGMSTVDAFYLSCMTFTTVGYGDIAYPATAAGRAVVLGMALGGVAFFGLTIELFHSMREKTDGAFFRLLGIRGGAASILMLLVNAAAGVALCQARCRTSSGPSKAWSRFFPKTPSLLPAIT